LTDIIVTEAGDLYVTTGSFNWPNSSDGGVRKSMDDGDTWVNLMDAYTARTIIEGPDGELLASVWEYPQDEGLYRSTDEGANWELLVDVPSGNNIFSIAVLPGSPKTIFAGTRTGVYRSLDNGASWAYSNAGMPADAWVRGMAVSPEGYVAAGTTKGLYVSDDMGDNWELVTGDTGSNDTIVSVAFYTLPDAKDEETRLYAGAADGTLLVASVLTYFTVAAFLHSFLPAKEITRTSIILVTANLYAYFFVSIYANFGGNMYMSANGPGNWALLMSGLGSNLLVSMFAAHLVAANTIKLFMGVYNNEPVGSTVYRNTIEVPLGIGDQPFAGNGMMLGQNFPNPFADKTTISFKIKNQQHTTLELFDPAGKKVSTLVDQTLSKGTHTIQLEKGELEPGMYYYVLTSGNSVHTKKLILN
ncbi:MAG: T9SS type A sorting domain-containing protein, partial [Bacteroidales bacterium]|nr:T9SS type A sorting domain-containing protein [Bacteroidales bacterium]